MATYEQCECALKEKLKNKEDVVTFTSKSWPIGQTTNAAWKTDGEYVQANISRILKLAEKEKRLDQLGRKLGIFTDREQERRSTEYAKKRAGWAFRIAVLALVVTALGVFLQWWNAGGSAAGDTASQPTESAPAQ